MRQDSPTIESKRSLRSIGLAGLLLAASAGSTQTQSKAKQGGPPLPSVKELVALLEVENPHERKKQLRKLIRGKSRKIERYEALVARVPMPPQAARIRPGRVQDVRADLWAGKKEGVLDTEVVAYLPSAMLDANDDNEKDKESKRWPLMIACHGSGGNARQGVGEWRHVAENIGMMIVCATEQRANEGYRSSEQERLTQLSLRRWALRHLPVDVDRIYLAGTSRGGHLVWDLGTRHPDLWGALVCLIGGPRLNVTNGESSLRLVENLLDVPLRDLQGANDDPGLVFNVKLAFEALKDARDAKLHLFPELGHSYRLDVVDWKQWLLGQQRPSAPTRVLLRSVRLDQARRSWLRLTKFERKKVKDRYRPRVDIKVWDKLDNNGRKRWVYENSLGFTARVVAKLSGNAAERSVHIEAERGVQSAELLLPRSLWPQQPEKKRVRLVRGGRSTKLRPKPDVEAFLLDWLEHLDPKRAPVAIAKLRL